MDSDLGLEEEKHGSAFQPVIVQQGLELSGSGLTDAALVEKLGRERPHSFPNAWSEVAFCFSIVMSQIMAV